MKSKEIFAPDRRRAALHRLLWLAMILLCLGSLSGGVYLGSQIVAPLLTHVQSAWNPPFTWCAPYDTDDVVYSPPPPGFNLHREAQAQRDACEMKARVSPVGK